LLKMTIKDHHINREPPLFNSRTALPVLG
jgi:hypothetical protein